MEKGPPLYTLRVELLKLKPPDESFGVRSQVEKWRAAGAAIAVRVTPLLGREEVNEASTTSNDASGV